MLAYEKPTVSFDGPPPSVVHSGQKFEWDPMISELKANPKTWGIVHPLEGQTQTRSAAQQVSQRLKTGRGLAGVKRGDFESTVRGTTIYARYVGDN